MGAERLVPLAIVKKGISIVENILKMVLDFISTLVPQKTGTKFLVALSGISAVLYMAVKEIGTDVHLYIVFGMLVLYFIADIISKRKVE